MNFQFISNSELIQRMQKLVRTERKITHLILLYIIEIENRKIFAHLGFDSMYSYLTRGLGYSEGSAYRRLQSARLLKQVPEASKKVESGSLNLSQLTQVQKCLNEKAKSGETLSPVNAIEILSKLENKNSVETQKTLSLELNLPIVAEEKIKPQRDDSIRLEITLSKEQFKELEMAKNLLSHMCPDGSWAEVIATLAKGFNKKKLEGRTQAKLKNKNPIKLESRNKLKFEENEPKLKGGNKSTCYDPKRSTQSALVARVTRERKYISIFTKRALLEKAHHSCEYLDPISKRPCHSKYQLQIDHIIPKAFGGKDDLSNLRVFCRTHNLLAAQRMGLRAP